MTFAMLAVSAIKNFKILIPDVDAVTLAVGRNRLCLRCGNRNLHVLLCTYYQNRRITPPFEPITL
jgi:hypothetical protein